MTSIWARIRGLAGSTIGPRTNEEAQQDAQVLRHTCWYTTRCSHLQDTMIAQAHLIEEQQKTILMLSRKIDEGGDRKFSETTPGRPRNITFSEVKPKVSSTGIGPSQASAPPPVKVPASQSVELRSPATPVTVASSQPAPYRQPPPRARRSYGRTSRSSPPQSPGILAEPPGSPDLNIRAKVGPYSPPLVWDGTTQDLIELTIRGRSYFAMILPDSLIKYFNKVLNINVMIRKHMRDKAEELEDIQSWNDELKDLMRKVERGEHVDDEYAMKVQEWGRNAMELNELLDQRILEQRDRRLRIMEKAMKIIKEIFRGQPIRNRGSGKWMLEVAQWKINRLTRPYDPEVDDPTIPDDSAYDSYSDGSSNFSGVVEEEDEDLDVGPWDYVNRRQQELAPVNGSPTSEEELLVDDGQAEAGSTKANPET